MFYSLTAHRVHDKVRFKEGGETLLLSVDADPDHLVAGLLQAEKLMKAIDTPESVDSCAEFFSKLIFGEAQSKKLLDFYFGNRGVVLELLCRYFTERLNKKIMKEQKRRQK